MFVSQLAESRELVKKSTVNRGLFNGSEQTDCDLKKWWFAFQSDAAKVGIPLRVVWGWRSWGQQQDMLDRGVSNAAPGQSPHNYGLALDIIHMRRAWEDMPRDGWLLLAAMGKEVARKQGLSLTWGGDWNNNGVPVFEDPKEKFWDAAHWQLTDWRDKLASPCVCAGGCMAYHSVTLPLDDT